MRKILRKAVKVLELDAVYRYVFYENIIAVISPDSELAYYNRHVESCDAEDILSELCEEGIISPTATFKEEKVSSVAGLVEKISDLNCKAE
jgi:hypothetical protein